MKVPVVLLPTLTVPVRDIDYCTVNEAQLVCASLQASKDFPTDSGIKIVQSPDGIIGGEANIYPDGRLGLLIQFTLQRVEKNSEGRDQEVSVVYNEIAGQLLEFLENKDAGTWEFLAENNDDGTWTGDVEMN